MSDNFNNSNNAEFDFDSEWESFSSSPSSDFSQNNGINNNTSNFIDENSNDEFEEFSSNSPNYFNFGDEEIANSQQNNNFGNNSQSQTNSTIDDYWANQNKFNQPAQDNQPMQNQFMQGQNNQFMQGQNNQWQGQPMQNQGMPDPSMQAQFQNQQIPNPMQQNNNLFGSLKDSIPKQSNLGYKGVGVVIIVALIIVAIIVICFIRIKPKQQVSSNNNNYKNTEVQDNSSQQDEEVFNGLSLVEIPSSTQMQYGDILTGKGVVTGFNRYLVDNQVLYCIYLNVDGKNAKYFCSRSVYSNVQEGEELVVTYKLIDNHYISIDDISRN